jgi:hypothetical protein
MRHPPPQRPDRRGTRPGAAVTAIGFRVHCPGHAGLGHTLGLASSQACYATTGNHEAAVLLQLVGELDLEGVLIQADARPYPAPVFWPFQEQDAEFLLTVPANPKTLHPQIHSQFQGKLKIPLWELITRLATAATSPGRCAPNRLRSTSVRPRWQPAGS